MSFHSRHPTMSRAIFMCSPPTPPNPSPTHPTTLLQMFLSCMLTHNAGYLCRGSRTRQQSSLDFGSGEPFLHIELGLVPLLRTRFSIGLTAGGSSRVLCGGTRVMGAGDVTRLGKANHILLSCDRLVGRNVSLFSSQVSLCASTPAQVTLRV